MIKIEKQLIEKLLSLKTPAVIAVSGFGGSGKSTFANLLGKEINAPVIDVDSFMKDRTITNYTNWEVIDFDRLEREVLIPFTEGKNPIQYGHFDWGKNEIVEKKEALHSRRIIIEGVGLFRPNLVKYFAFKIWIDCLVEDAIARGKKRDREEYKNPQDENWNGVWKKNDKEYFAAYKPKEIADSVIDNCSI